jgi:hypothetical protein
MKLTRALPWIIFFLVLVVTWKILGGSSGYEIQKGVADVSMKGSSDALVKSSRYSKKERADYPGGDIKTVTGSLAMCKISCNSDKNCVGFVRGKGSNYSWNKCYLKNAVTSSTARVDPNRNAYGKSGILLPEVLQTVAPWNRDHVNWTYEKATDYPGNDLGGIANQTDTSCTNACAKITGCAGVTRQVDRPGYCWFKSAKGKGEFKRDTNSIFFS